MTKKIQSKNIGSYFLIIIAVVVLDQLSKWIVKFSDLNLVTNTGSVFGIFKGANDYLIFFSLIALGLIMFYWDKIILKEKVFFSLILGGIVGNLIDRIFYGYVIDFISFSFWPAFNLADSALTIGVIGLIYLELKK